VYNKYFFLFNPRSVFFLKEPKMRIGLEDEAEEKYDNNESTLRDAEAEIKAILGPISTELRVTSRQDCETCNYYVLHSNSLTYRSELEKAVKESLSPCYSIVETDTREPRENWPTPVPMDTLAVKREALPHSPQEKASQGGPLSFLLVLIISYAISILYRFYYPF